YRLSVPDLPIPTNGRAQTGSVKEDQSVAVKREQLRSELAQDIQRAQPARPEVVAGAPADSGAATPVSAEHTFPLAPVDAAMLVNNIGTRVMASRIDRMGEADSGAYNHYRRLVDRGRAFVEYEEELVKLLSELPSFSAYHEIGSGIGTLPIMLGLSGR